jgi:hypothetical protein
MAQATSSSIPQMVKGRVESEEEEEEEKEKLNEEDEEEEEGLGRNEICCRILDRFRVFN